MMEELWEVDEWKVEELEGWGGRVGGGVEELGLEEWGVE